jgi:hypothetical protein
MDTNSPRTRIPLSEFILAYLWLISLSSLGVLGVMAVHFDSDFKRYQPIFALLQGRDSVINSKRLFS